MLLTTWISFLLFFLAVVMLVIYIYMTRYFNYWKKRGVPYIKPIPFLGSFKEIAMLQVDGATGIKNIYDAMDTRYFGIFVFDRPVLMLKCPTLIHEVLVKSSSQFLDRTIACSDHTNISSNLLMFQKNPKWKESRRNITPVFSPLKLKGMFSLIDDLCPNMMKSLAGDKIVDIKNVVDPFICDINARCFFGISTDCVNNENSEFARMYNKLFSFTWRNALVHSGYMFKPDVLEFFGTDFLIPEGIEYFSNVFKDTLRKRGKLQGKAIDLIDVVKEMEEKIEKEGREITKEETEEIIAVALTFVIGGIPTVSANLSLTFYELAMQPDLQDRLRNEITDNVAKHGGITYDGMQDMKFIDMCTSETIRKYPLLANICRKAADTYTFHNANLTIDKGTFIYIPLYGLQMDKKYFPNPEQYNPDRFQNFSKTEGEAYFLPFGAGPRGCIGERFAVMVAKVVIMHTLLNFKLEKCASTPEKLELEIKSINVLPREKLNIKIVPLKDS